jgi:hypothetical protein
MRENLLPDAFADLSPLVDEWCLAVERDRAFKRVDTDIETLRSFCGTMRPRIDAIIEYLNSLPNNVDALSPPDGKLYHLALMFMEASAPVDLDWPSGDIEDTFPMERYKFLM